MKGRRNKGKRRKEAEMRKEGKGKEESKALREEGRGGGREKLTLGFQDKPGLVQVLFEEEKRLFKWPRVNKRAGSILVKPDFFALFWVGKH